MMNENILDVMPLEDVVKEKEKFITIRDFMAFYMMVRNKAISKKLFALAYVIYKKIPSFWMNYFVGEYKNNKTEWYFSFGSEIEK